jgi:hypothetical protein
MEQCAKSKMNFLGLHTYHNEPTAWPGLGRIVALHHHPSTLCQSR